MFEAWLRVSRLRANDLVLVFSVGGGDLENNVSPNLVAALQYAKTVGAKILGIVGRDGGHTAKLADVCVIIPTVNPVHITPHTEAFQAIVWHLLVSHPAVKQQQTKWESTVLDRAQLRPAVFLDRDGVVNRAVVRDGKPFPPSNLEEARDPSPGWVIAARLESARIRSVRHHQPARCCARQPDSRSR